MQGLDTMSRLLEMSCFVIKDGSLTREVIKAEKRNDPVLLKIVEY